MRRFLETIIRIFRNTIHHLIRGWGHSLAAILVMTLALYSVLNFAAAVFYYNQVLQQLKNRPRLTVFFVDETTEEEILNLKKSLEARPEVKLVQYISKEEALKLYQQENAERPELLEFVTADILPASLQITTTEVEFQEKIARELAANPRVENVLFHRDVVKKLVQLANSVKMEALIWALLLVIVAVFTILVVVSLSLSSFGKEIEIMRLVGASTWFIRFPFLLQGIIYGLIAAGGAFGLLFLIPYLKNNFWGQWQLGFWSQNIATLPQWFLLRLWGGATALGAFLGALASSLAIRKYLRV